MESTSERVLLDSVSRVCSIPLDMWTACKRGNLRVVRLIIESDSAHVDDRDDYGVTLLMVRARCRA
jgi:hypothetical protein